MIGWIKKQLLTHLNNTKVRHMVQVYLESYQISGYLKEESMFSLVLPGNKGDVIVGGVIVDLCAANHRKGRLFAAQGQVLFVTSEVEDIKPNYYVTLEIHDDFPLGKVTLSVCYQSGRKVEFIGFFDD